MWVSPCEIPCEIDKKEKRKKRTEKKDDVLMVHMHEKSEKKKWMVEIFCGWVIHGGAHHANG